jgi:hypothetical protein
MLICEKCSKPFTPLRKRSTQKRCPDCNKATNRTTAKQYKSHARNPEAFLRWKYSKLTDRVKKMKKSIVSDITINELIAIYNAQQGKCALSGLPMTHNAPGFIYSNISIDRIDPNGGYTKNNVRLVMKILNTLRNDGSDVDLYQFVEETYEGMRKIRSV